MFEQDAQQSLQTPGSREDAAAVKRWLVIAMGLALGESLSSVMLAFAIANWLAWPSPRSSSLRIEVSPLNAAAMNLALRSLFCHIDASRLPSVA